VSTSGSRNFTVSRSEIIQEAVANIGVLDPGNTLSAEENQRASVRLNLMIKGWMARGANLWRREEVILFLQSGQQAYTFGTDYFAKASQVVETTLSAGFGAGAVNLTIEDRTGIANGDFIGIKMDDGSIYWPPAGAANIVPAAGPDLVETFYAAPSSASAGAKVYSYPYTGSLPFLGTNDGQDAGLNATKIAFAYRRDYAGTDTPVRFIGREEYSALSRKSASGPVMQLCHDRQLFGRVLVWPTVDVTTDKLHLITDRIIEDFDSVADTPDFPFEWQNALMWGLSAELSNVYGLPIQERQWLKGIAKDEFDSANSFDVEEAPVRFEFESR
jgi:hypothetical protein